MPYPTEAADNIEMPLPSGPQTFFLGSLLAPTVLAAVYAASSIILAIVVAFRIAAHFVPAPSARAEGTLASRRALYVWITLSSLHLAGSDARRGPSGDRSG
jgi:hypothetical protein